MTEKYINCSAILLQREQSAKVQLEGTFSKSCILHAIEKTFITNTTMEVSVQEINSVLLSCIAPWVPFPFAARAVITCSTAGTQSPHGEADGSLARS